MRITLDKGRMVAYCHDDTPWMAVAASRTRIGAMGIRGEEATWYLRKGWVVL